MITTLQNAPIPLRDPAVDEQRRVSTKWAYFWTDVLNVLNLCSSRAGGAQLTGQAASIGATDLTDGTFPAGLYRLNYYMRVTQAATVSSSLAITFSWTDGGVVQTLAGAAIVDGTATSWQSFTLPIYTDASSPVTYEITYASAGATAMEYKLGVWIERAWT